MGKTTCPKMMKQFQAVKKSYQAQSKNLTQNSPFINLDHLNQFKACSCHTFKVKILHRDIFWFFLHDEEFVSRTINDGNVDLDKFPASKVRHLAKRMESSKATTCHMKQVAGDPQAEQINLLRHQCTELPAGKYKKIKPCVKS